ncbi:MAG: tripartite tricarboxylate transporter substrate-binding protein [Casimicrobiaceae bacterium]|nr:tripartite tricarboxylate transporter substrate-binding protein [Casimicrobiaceae bacterium]MCX8099033.1 tripartite tricarboxylate transporter substrate-binding protein [Casimicrobiaceae bacterium]MDW8312903.1 tripartite tricarboxylate transporter substrate-binding protein [Burkholderiales bacterium]
MSTSALRRILAVLFSVCLAAGAAAYPEKPITIVVPFAAGGPTDVVARTLAQALGPQLKGNVIVENTAGAGGTVGATRVARAAPDGYTLLFHHIGMSTAPSLYRKLEFKPLEDFIPVGAVVDVPMTLVGKPGLAPGNLKELLGWIRANKDKVNLANAGVGSASHLCGMLLQSMLKTDLTTVPFQGTGPAMTALLGGQVDLMCDQTTNTTGQIKAGRVKAYAVTSKNKLANFPDLPPLASELPGFEVGVWHILYAPKGTPANVIATLEKALQAAIKDPAFVAKMKELGAEIMPAEKQTSAGARTLLSNEIQKWSPIIQAAKVYAD